MPGSDTATQQIGRRNVFERAAPCAACTTKRYPGPRLRIDRDRKALLALAQLDALETAIAGRQP